MNILFVHQAFPGQYIHIIRRLALDSSIRIVGLGIEVCSVELPENVHYHRYALSRGNSTTIHPLALETESKVIRAEAAAAAAYELSGNGFTPDVICAHPGWGEALFLKDIWPQAKLICYQEFYYNTSGFDLQFDPELQGKLGWKDAAKARMKNANLLLSLEASDWNVTPTQFQKSSFPEHFQDRFSVIHDGIDIDTAKPGMVPSAIALPRGQCILTTKPVVTFVNRTIEPYRGCHTFIRSIPQILRNNPDAQIVITGQEIGVSYGRKCPSGEWKEWFLDQIRSECDVDQIIFTGTIPHQLFITLLQASWAHVYLTYPFVLSWSLLEAMACECALVVSDTAPLHEVINNGENGLYVNFFSSSEVASAITRLLKDRTLATALGHQARQTVVDRYSLDQCVSDQIALIKKMIKTES